MSSSSTFQPISFHEIRVVQYAHLLIYAAEQINKTTEYNMSFECSQAKFLNKENNYLVEKIKMRNVLVAEQYKVLYSGCSLH